MSDEHPVLVIFSVVGEYWFVRTPKTDAGIAATAYELLAVGSFLVNSSRGWNRRRDWVWWAWYGWVKRGGGGWKMFYGSRVMVFNLVELHQVIFR